MSNKQDFTRRALLTGAGTAVASAALAVAVAPTLANADDVDLEAQGEQLDELMHRISAILDTAMMGTFCAVIEPSQHVQANVSLMPISRVRKALATQGFLDQASPSSLVEYQLTQLTVAMRKWHGGSWAGRVEHGDRHITVSEQVGEKSGAWVSFPIGD